MIVLRSLLFNLLFFAWCAVMFVAGLPALAVSTAASTWLQYVWARGIFALLAVVCGLRYEVRGREHLPAGACIVASKHQSAWDTMVFALLVEGPSYVVKRELLWVPLFGWYILRTGCIGVDRRGGMKALRGLVADARRTAALGRKIVIFPEGTRVAPGARRPYHPGVAALYAALDLPVVPVALNSGVFWGRRAFVKKPGRIVVEILPPIPPGLPRKVFAARLEEAIETASDRLLAEARAGAAARAACG